MKKNLVFSQNERFVDKNSKNYYPDIFFAKYSSNEHFISIEIDDFRKLNQRFKIKEKYLEKAFDFFCEIINSTHKNNKLNYKKYRLILFRHWFEIFLDIYIQRYFTLIDLLKKNSYDSITLIDNHFSLIDSNFSHEILENCQDEIWNYCLFQEIYNNLNYEIITKKIINIKIEKKISIKNKLKKKIFKFYNKTIWFLNFLKNKQSIIMNSYLGFKNEILIQIKLLQFPYLWREILYEDLNLNKKYNFDLRKSFSNKIENEINDNFLRNFLKASIFFMPKSFLENFENVDINSKKIFNIKKIDFIFTSVSYAFDDIFKRLLANNYSKNSKLVIGQHGIGFPLEKNTNIIGIPRSELKFYDYYLQWGDYKENKIKGLICSSIISKRDYLNDYHSGINTKKILIQIIQPHIEIQNKLFNTKSYFLNFLKDFNNLLNNFDQELLNNIFIKLHSYDLDNAIRKDIWKKEIQNHRKVQSNIDNNLSIKKINQNTKIYLFNYFSTGFLECISENIPCLMYCPNYKDFFNNDVIKIIEPLLQHNLIFDNYDNISKFLNKNYNSIDEWWQNHNFKISRDIFSKLFAQKNSLNQISVILKNIKNIKS